MLTLSAKCVFSWPSWRPLIHSSGEALPIFWRRNSGAKYHPNIGVVCGDTHSALAMADHQPELTNTNPPPGTGGNIPPKTPKQPWNTGGWEIDDG
ncbi:hypothetical protein PIB30_054614 [Stylosanthes scabra]|uniref:Uncharacterized protein n=1 Tax=Stylosanthes scabra TaxID=79078 RepID=A0ABU6SJM2_9FABA|nr:hypothetical protein [Stylosanthes scabra]